MTFKDLLLLACVFGILIYFQSCHETNRAKQALATQAFINELEKDPIMTITFDEAELIGVQ